MSDETLDEALAELLLSGLSPMNIVVHDDVSYQRGPKMDERELIPGRFYWALPTWDCDAEEEWSNQWQPALYKGDDAWQWIGDVSDDWPACAVGPEVVRKETLERVAPMALSGSPLTEYSFPEPLRDWDHSAMELFVNRGIHKS